MWNDEQWEKRLMIGKFEQSEMPEFLEIGRSWGQIMKDFMFVPGHCVVKRDTEADFTTGSPTLLCRTGVFKRLWVN